MEEARVLGNGISLKTGCCKEINIRLPFLEYFPFLIFIRFNLFS